MSGKTFSGVAAMVGIFGFTLLSPLATPGTLTESGSPPELSGIPQPPPLQLRLNIPAYRLDVFERGERVHSYPVAVGSRRYPTPVREFTISRVVWNPWWYPPPSEWARDEKPAPPGPDNPMGRVKLQASEYIYIHGTPLEGSIGSAASHGCIRMRNQDAIELARLVHSWASDTITAPDLDALEANRRRTTTIELDAPITFISEYRLAEVIDGILLLHADIYGRAPADPLRDVRAVISDAAGDHEAVDEEQLKALWRASRREKVAVPLDSLLPPARQALPLVPM